MTTAQRYYFTLQQHRPLFNNLSGFDGCKVNFAEKPRSPRTFISFFFFSSASTGARSLVNLSICQYFFFNFLPLSALFLKPHLFFGQSPCLYDGLSIFICLSIFLKSLKHQHTQLWNSLHKTQFNHSFACFFTNTCWTVILAYIIFNVLVIFCLVHV